MEIAKVKSLRRSTSKSRGGCLTCKNRRIKCDEAKPVCMRCSRSKRLCQGYIDPFQYHSAVDISVVSACSLPVLYQGRFANPVFYSTTKEFEGFLTDQGLLQEKRSFQHFITQASVRIPSILDLRVWTEFIPMLSTTFPAIRYALFALSAQHEVMLHNSPNHKNGQKSKSSKPVMNTLRIFSHRQYGKAIRRLNTILVDAVQKYDVLIETLFACLLLVVCEVLRGSDVAAQYHLDGAIRLICMPSAAKSQLLLADNNSNWGASSPLGLFKELSLLFQQLDLQAATFSGPRTPVSPEDIDPFSQYIAYNLPGAQESGKDVNGESTIEELRQVLLSVQVKICRFIDSETVVKSKYRSRSNQTQTQEDEFNTVQKLQEDLLEELGNWKRNFDTIPMESKESSRPAQEGATIVMLLSYLTSYILLSTSLSPDETAYDSHSAMFARITELSEIFLQQQQQQLESNALPSSLSFSIDMQIIHPLYITALKCRDFTTRHRALCLLSMCGKEGIWDGRMMASVAQSVVGCEEESATGLNSGSQENQSSMVSIPERARIHGVGIVGMVKEKGDVNMVCFRRTDMDNQDPWERILLSAEF